MKSIWSHAGFCFHMPWERNTSTFFHWVCHISATNVALLKKNFINMIWLNCHAQYFYKAVVQYTSNVSKLRTSHQMQLRDAVLRWLPRYRPCTARSALRSPTSAAKRTNWAGARWSWASCKRRRLSWSRACCPDVSNWTASLSPSKRPRRRSTRWGCTGHSNQRPAKTPTRHKEHWKNPCFFQSLVSRCVLLLIADIWNMMKVTCLLFAPAVLWFLLWCSRLKQTEVKLLLM